MPKLLFEFMELSDMFIPAPDVLSNKDCGSFLYLWTADIGCDIISSSTPFLSLLRGSRC